MKSPASTLANASRFYVKTPMAEALHNRIVQWTWCGMTGGVIVGDARCGKTMAIRALSDKIDARTGQNIPLFRVTYGLRDVKTVKTVFDRIARSLGFAVGSRKTSDQLLDLICTYLAEAALVTETRQVILVVDEAQLLSLTQLSAFAEIYNVLFDIEVNVVILFVANKDQFGPIASRLLEKEFTYIRERFFSNIFHFQGITNREDLAQCLKAFDEYVVDPESGAKATEYYCPELYQTGWRLASIAPMYWGQYRERYMIPMNHDSWGMSHFIRATNLLVMDFLPRCTDPSDTAMIEACIIKSLKSAGIEPSLAQLAS